MILFNEVMYGDMARGIRESELINGCVELCYGSKEVVFLFVLDSVSGRRLERWMLLAFRNGIRCGSNFNYLILERWLWEIS